jgi:ankyrin repeat protein
VQLLLDTGKADLNTCDVKGETPLLVAVLCGHKTVVRQLLGTRMVDVNSQDEEGRTIILCDGKWR